MEIYRASPADAVVARSLLLEYYEAIGVIKRDSPAEIESLFSDAVSGLWIAKLDSESAGCVVLRPLPVVPNAAECKRLYVKPSFRGKGIAAALLDAMETFASAASAQWVYLDSHNGLEDALKIYRRRGYVDCARYNDNPQATIFMRKSLLPEPESRR